MYSFAIGVSTNKRQVYTNVINSAAGRCFSRQPHLVSLAKDVIESLKLTEPVVRVTYDMGRTIGNTSIVATNDNDLIFYAQRPKQSGVLRFVKNRSMEPSSELSVVLHEDSDGNYELADVWIGPAAPPFPGADNASEDSKAYWKTHALTAGSEPVSLQSVTSVCPY